MEGTIDLSLLTGFSFECRPGCGLCCFGTPAVSPAESARLLTIEPALKFRPGEDGFELMDARPEGGACQLLRDQRCRAHTARPFPCRAFPVAVHLGTRAQASLILSCPGVEIDGWGVRPTGRSRAPEGLAAEIAAVRAEAARVPLGAWFAGHRRSEERLLRKLSRRFGPEEPREILARIASELPPVPSGPEAGLSVPPFDAPLEELPIFFDERFGRVVARVGPVRGSYELLALRETGGVADRIGAFAVPESPWRLGAGARELLEGYERYLLARDHFLWSTYLEIESGAEGPLEDRLRGNLGEAAAEVLRRAAVRARALGDPAPELGREAVLRGIRATDSELMDRPTLGRLL